MTDRVRVFRILKYEGSREWIEKTLKKAIQGIKVISNPRGEDYTITAQTIDVFPEIIGDDNEYKPVGDIIGYKEK